MTVTQVYELMNSSTQEILGDTAVVKEDLTNVVDVGTEILNANAVDAYVKSLVNHIGKVIFVNRPYSGGAPSVLMDGWEYGSVLEKIQVDLPESEQNESWELTDGTSYDPNIFYKPSVSAKFFNQRVTFEVPRSFTEMQVKQSFSNAQQLNAFMSMIYGSVDKALTIDIDGLIMKTINNFIAETVYADYGTAEHSSKSGIKAVNLLYLYNQKYGTTLAADKALTTPEFIRFASLTMYMYMSRMRKITRLFNIGGKDRFTPSDLLHVIMLSDFRHASDVYLQSDTFHNEFTSLPKSEEVPYWQGSGTDYSFSSVSKVFVKTAGGHEVTVNGVLGVMFDRDALGVSNIDRRVTTYYNPKAEFFNNWFKFDAGYFNDMNENFVVFFIS